MVMKKMRSGDNDDDNDGLSVGERQNSDPRTALPPPPSSASSPPTQIHAPPGQLPHPHGRKRAVIYGIVSLTTSSKAASTTPSACVTFSSTNSSSPQIQFSSIQPISLSLSP
ncbi:unnamed protein product [Arabidopsis lyrata]|uniref:Expressed protein n=1 Tax=Arabidopsis lyrata subsp. lyrata TaxID=81972 RepID=D7KAL9_ARALL|nr:expressed protein [Arabidopsis lyrata subsp. lyrata]CAH8253624.1 unnamed protein product [Arabidopsis lyrata]